MTKKFQYSNLRRKFSLSLHGSSKQNNFTEYASPVPHLIESNAAPTDAERTLIQDAIDNISGELAPARDYSSLLEHEANKPKPMEDADVEIAQEFLRVHKAILSPFRRLPNEIIGEIICHYCQSVVYRDPYTEIRMAIGFWDNDVWPVVPSQVCQSWRGIALSLRHLWARIVFDTCIWELKRPPKRFLHVLKTGLSRSAGAPLAISICHQAPIQDRDFDTILDILMAHSDKWETLYITSYRSFLESFQRVKNNLPILRRLYLSICDPENGTGSPIDLFEVAPQLKMVHLNGPRVPEDVLLPLTQIERYVARSKHTNSAGDVVISNSPLVDLRMANLTLDDLLIYWPARSLDHLKYLHLDFGAPPNDAEDLDADNMLNSLTLPSICAIKITNYPDAILPPLIDLLSRSMLPGTCLWKLEFSTYHLREFSDELPSLFRLTPCLMSLSMYLPSSYVLSWLIQDPYSDIPPLLPNLQHLYFFVATDCLDGTEHELRQIAYTRCEIEDPKTSNNHAPYGQVRRLEDFRIIFPMTSLCHSELEILETKQTYFFSQESHARINILKDWMGVINSLPTFFYYHELTPPKMIKLRRALELSRFFTAIESICVEDVRELYVRYPPSTIKNSISHFKLSQVSDIHHLMYHLYKLLPSDLPGENIYHFRKRAKAMLDNWSFLLLKDIKNRNWAFQGQNSIYYVCSDHCKFRLIRSS